MKGIFYSNSNVIFYSQSHDPSQIKPAADMSTATDPLMSTYGKWEAVENSSLAIADASRLLLVPGRRCANGLPVPLRNPDWPRLVAGLREAALTSYKAAQTKDQDKMLEASDVLATACSNCHDKYREKPSMADRCK
jgi:cytochrome c553